MTAFECKVMNLCSSGKTLQIRRSMKKYRFRCLWQNMVGHQTLCKCINRQGGVVERSICLAGVCILSRYKLLQNYLVLNGETTPL